MKSLRTLAVALLATLSLSASAALPTREHRAIWVSPSLNYNWPSGTLVENHKNILRNRLSKFAADNINVLYYHARVNCDALYKSSYEPWSRYLSGTRGVEPAFDAFQFLVETAHEYGIEVYAWVNPYRYSENVNYGPGELNYENSHPDWLISNGSWTYLNPGLEEVKERVVNVISEIVTNYDVDGVVFDDYFYPSGGMSTTSSADDYATYKASGTSMTIENWRRSNVNDLVARVNKAIKAIKPYVVFGIGPAGVACPPNVTTEYGLPVLSGETDWQYNQIYSDPLAWLKAQSIDFISPQIYWPSTYDKIAEWWANAARKFGRHFYPSVDLADVDKYKATEFAREVEATRSFNNPDESGIAYFQFNQMVNYYERIDGVNLNLSSALAQLVCPTKTLTPLRSWDNSTIPPMVSNVAISGDKLTWDATSAGRYTIYAYPKTEADPFGGGVQYLKMVRYTNSYSLPSDHASYDWYVASYDRFGNESSLIGVGATPTTASAPVLTYPENGSSPMDLFNFTWTASNPGLAKVQIATDAQFNDIVGQIATDKKVLSITEFPALTAGQTYYWRIQYVPVGAPAVVSEVRSFVASRIAMTSPASASTGVSVTPTLTWTKAVDGADYKVEISRNANFNALAYETTVKNNTLTLPERTLTNGTLYYARVTASIPTASSTSEPITFTTVNRTDFTCPAFVNPVSDGTTLHADQALEVVPYDGLERVQINVSATKTFTRTYYTTALTNFATKDAKSLGDIKIGGAALVHGNTYYVCARAGYLLDGKTSPKYTSYTPVVSFVYSTDSGVSDIETDASANYIDAAGTLHLAVAAPVKAYTLDGRLAASYAPASEVDLSALPSGAYIIAVEGIAPLKYIH